MTSSARESTAVVPILLGPKSHFSSLLKDFVPPYAALVLFDQARLYIVLTVTKPLKVDFNIVPPGHASSPGTGTCVKSRY